MALGNGMPLEVWVAFQQRFQIPLVCEFYASTEGNANLVNHLGLPGVIGWIPPIAKWLYPLRIVRYDETEEQPWRDPRTQKCAECEDGEVGELLARIDVSDPLRHFDGYTSAEATRCKVLRGVFAGGDSWFRSGDLVAKDPQGFVRFVDRIGDTFRWKGENVATTEVAASIGAFRTEQQKKRALLPSFSSASTSSPARPLPPPVGIKEVNVYGVVVQGNDGRAGMASIVLGRDEEEPEEPEAHDRDLDHEAEELLLHERAQPQTGPNNEEDPAALQAQFDFGGLYRSASIGTDSLLARME